MLNCASLFINFLNLPPKKVILKRVKSKNTVALRLKLAREEEEGVFKTVIQWLPRLTLAKNYV